MNMFNPHSTEWLLNKFDIYKELRARDIAYWSEDYQLYVITRYDDVIGALRDPATFSSAKGNLIVEDPERFGRTMGASDDPRHAFFKSIVIHAYSKDNIERINKVFSEKAIEILSGKKTIDLSDVTNQLSSWTVAEIINAPGDKEHIKDLVMNMQLHSSMCVNEDIDDTSSNEFKKIFKDIVESDISPESIGPGICHEYIKNNVNKYYIPSLFNGPAVSGASSLTGALQFLALDLYRNDQVKTIMEDMSLIPNAVSESLRYHATTGRFSRTVTKETVVHGVTLKPNDRVALCWDSANRDPSKFVDPDVFDLHRDTKGNLAFGHGIHACVANAISKTLMSSFLKILLETVGEYRVVTKSSDMKYLMTASGTGDVISNLLIEKQ